MNIPYSFQGWVKKISPQSTVQILRRLLFLNNHFLDHCSNLRMVLHGIQVSLKTSNLTCIRAKFKSTSGTVKFYNPDLDIGNKQIVTLSNNPLNMVSKNTVIGLGKSLTTNEVNGLISGTTIGQENNPNFSAKLIRILGAVGINSDLTLTNPGSDFATGTPTYTDVPLVSVTGRGSGAQEQLSLLDLVQ